jgi:hypothetical protein
VKDVVASHDTLINLFERIHFFLHRLDSYTRVPLTNGFTELLGKVMAQILSILALSTKAVTERRISELIDSLCPFYADDGLETFLKRLIGRTNVEDALLRLDSLTKEESLMAVARNLVATHRVDGNVQETKNLAEVIDHNVKATKDGA